MPYRRSFKKYKRVGRSKRGGGMLSRFRRYANTGANVASLAYSAYKGVKYIKSLINVEKKFHDVVQGGFTVTSTASISNLSNIAQGNDYNNRDGNSILLQYLYWRMILNANSTANSNFCRIIIFQDNDQRGVDPTAADLLESTAAGTILTSPLLHTVGKRFNVLMDKTFTVDMDGKSNIALKKVFKFPMGTHIKYRDTTAADSANYEGSLYILQVSNDAVNGPLLQWNARLRFTDN